MKQLKCADLGGKDCPFVATGNTDEEVIKKMAEHGMKVHADVMKDSTQEDMDKWDKMARGKITDA